jgi:hypothetical protein
VPKVALADLSQRVLAMSQTQRSELASKLTPYG